MKTVFRRFTPVLLLGLTGHAWAHTGHATAGFAAGLAHPFTGLDHLLAAFAVGLWAAQSPRNTRLWQLPATFMTALALGGALAMGGIGADVPAAGRETGIALSVLALGLVIALAARLPTAVSLALAALFGLLHGHAHGLELPQPTSPAAYAAGFLLATAALHASGLALGRATPCRGWLVRAVGTAIALGGAGFLLAG